MVDLEVNLNLRLNILLTNAKILFLDKYMAIHSIHYLKVQAVVEIILEDLVEVLFIYKEHKLQLMVYSNQMVKNLVEKILIFMVEDLVVQFKLEDNFLVKDKYQLLEEQVHQLVEMVEEVEFILTIHYIMISVLQQEVIH